MPWSPGAYSDCRWAGSVDRNWHETFARIAIASGWLMPLALLVLVVTSTWVRVPHYDQWVFAHQLARHSGEVGLDELWEQHNEHRVLFPKILMLLVAGISDWDVRWEMALSLALAVAILLLLRRLMTKTMEESHPQTLATSGTAILIFSLAQWENWTWGWQLGWYLTIVALVGAILIIQTWPRGWRTIYGVGAAATLAVVAQYSLASGTFVWPSVLVTMAAHHRFRPLTLPWIGVGLVSTLLYLQGYEKPPHHPDLTGASDVESILGYSIRLIGHAFFTDSTQALIAGTVAISIGILTVLTLGRTTFSPMVAPWSGIAVFATLTTGVTAVGRSGFGLGQAASSRYTTVSLLFIVAICAMASIAWSARAASQSHRRHGASRILASAPFVLAAAMTLFTAPANIARVRVEEGRRIAEKQCVASVESPDDTCLQNIEGIDPHSLFATIQYLRSRNWL